ncbi:hypothetical protein ACFL20_08800, partial [Spirochaetota bacterium]
MRNVAKTVLSIVIILFLAGCVRYYRTSRIKKQYNKSIRKVGSINLKVKKDFSKRKKIYNSIMPYVVQKDRKPYAVFKNHLDEMKMIIGKLDMSYK